MRREEGRVDFGFEKRELVLGQEAVEGTVDGDVEERVLGFNIGGREVQLGVSREPRRIYRQFGARLSAQIAHRHYRKCRVAHTGAPHRKASTIGIARTIEVGKAKALALKGEPRGDDTAWRHCTEARGVRWDTHALLSAEDEVAAVEPVIGLALAHME